MTDLHTRRTFLRAAIAASAAWAAADLAEVEDALAWAAQQTAQGKTAPHKGVPYGDGAFSVLTPAQAMAVEALTSRIIPSIDGRPGAREAGAVHFIDKSLATFNARQKTLYADGVRDLNRRAARAQKGTTSFAALTTAQQDELLRAIEKTPFFQTARFDTIVGTFALPTLGGNRDYAGWHMLGFEHQPRFQAPFGHYDAEINKRS
jgi:gluconate 2-dehydrogenase gamma chain